MSDPLIPAQVQGYHDFAGLASLRGDAARQGAAALRQTAEQFEAHFIQQMMKTMREAVERSELMENRDGDMFQDLMDKELSVKMAQRSAIGLADMLERQFKQQAQPVTAHQALSAREKAWPPRPEALPLAGAATGLPAPQRPDGRAPLLPLRKPGHE